MLKLKQQQMIEKGWLPDFTPNDAKDIDIQGDLDIGTAYGLFTSADTSAVRAQCRKRISAPRLSPDLSQRFAHDARAGSIKTKQYELFACDEPEWTVAVTQSGTTVFYISQKALEVDQ